MSVTSWIRRQFKNGVTTAGTLNASLGSGVTTSFTLGVGQGATFPDGSVGPFIVTIDQGQATEEKVLCQSRSTDTFTIASNGRGYNGTSAQNHNSGASVYHTVDAQDFDEANQVAVQTLGAIVASGDLLVGSGANALSKLARGSNSTFLQTSGSTLQWTAFGAGQSQTIGASNADGTQTTPARSDHTHSGVTTFNTRNGAVVPGNADYLSVSTGGLTGATTATRFVGGTTGGAPVSGTFAAQDFVTDANGVIWVCTVAGTPGTWVSLVPAQAAAWSTYTPTWNGTLGNGTLQGKYQKIGRMVALRINLIIGSTSTPPGGQWTFALPFNTPNDGVEQEILHKLVVGATTFMSFAILPANSGSAQPYLPVDTTHSTHQGLSGTPLGLTTNNNFTIQGVYESVS